jgi:NodT family efflux transporter outer membrane factor (OMF) lipoprotein
MEQQARDSLVHGLRRAPLALACAAAVGLIAVAGCASVNAGVARPAVEAPVPASWTRTATGVSSANEDLARWWERFDDATLNGLIDRALRGNRDLNTARSRLRQARAQIALAGANRLPSVSLSGSGSANDTTQSNATGTASGGIDASWELDVFGELRDAELAARADAASTEESLHNTQVSLVAEVATDYANLRGYQQRLAIARQNLASQEETLQITEWRAQAGLVSTLDVDQARTTVFQTRAGIPSLESSVAQSEHALAILLGVEPASLVGQLDVEQPIPTLPAQVGAGIPANALRQRPDVRAAERTIVAETARLAKAKVAKYPSFTLNGSLTAQAVSGALTGGTSLVTSLVASVAHTLWDGGRIRQQIEIQGAVQEQAVSSYEATILTALKEVEDALVALEKNRLRLGSLQSAAESARSAAQLARTRYDVGLVDFQTVLDTERTALSAEDSVASAQATQVTNLIQLYKALGGGWSFAEPTSASDSQAGTQ